VVSLEHFLPVPQELVDELAQNEGSPFDVLDEDIMCGIARNLKEMEAQYGRSPDNLSSLQTMADFMAEACGL
jgi:hypothetical protein